MPSFMFDYIFADYKDPENQTGKCPGFLLNVAENDGGVGILLWPDGKQSDPDVEYSVFMNVDEAKKLVDGINDAIKRAEIKLKSGTAIPPLGRTP